MATKKPKKPKVAKTIYQALKTVRISPFQSPEKSIEQIARAVQRAVIKYKKTRAQINRELGVVKRELGKTRPDLLRPELFKTRAIEGVGISVRRAVTRKAYIERNRVRINTVRRGNYWFKKELRVAQRIVKSSHIFEQYVERMKEGGGGEFGARNQALGRGRVGTTKRMGYNLKTVRAFIAQQKERAAARRGLSAGAAIGEDVRTYVYYILKFEPTAIANSENEQGLEFYNKYQNGPGKYDVDLNAATPTELWNILTEEAKEGFARFVNVSNPTAVEDVLYEEAAAKITW